MAKIKGSCICGKVTYSILDEPFFTQACHCKDCKKSTGSSFVIATMVFEGDLIIEGEVSSTELPTGSGAGQRAYFCVNCGVYLYCKYKVGEAERRVAIRTKTLDDSDKFPPQAHIFVKDKDSWIDLTNSQNCFETMYDREKVWPEESLKRLKLKLQNH